MPATLANSRPPVDDIPASASRDAIPSTQPEHHHHLAKEVMAGVRNFAEHPFESVSRGVNDLIDNKKATELRDGLLVYGLIDKSRAADIDGSNSPYERWADYEQIAREYADAIGAGAKKFGLLSNEDAAKIDKLDLPQRLARYMTYAKAVQEDRARENVMEDWARADQLRDELLKARGINPEQAKDLDKIASPEQRRAAYSQIYQRWENEQLAQAAYRFNGVTADIPALEPLKK